MKHISIIVGLVLIAGTVNEIITGDHNILENIIENILINEYRNKVSPEDIFIGLIIKRDEPRSKNWLSNRPIKIIYLFG